MAIEQATREERIKSLVPLARMMARNLARKMPMADVEDLTSEAMVGAIQAVDRWSEEAGVPLAQFASTRIRGQMYDYLREIGPLSRSHWKRVCEGEVEFRLQSLSDPIGEATLLVDALSDDSDSIGQMLDIHAVRQVIDIMSEDDRALLIEYYYEGLTLREIGERRGVTESRISQKMKKVYDVAYRYIGLDQGEPSRV